MLASLSWSYSIISEHTFRDVFGVKSFFSAHLCMYFVRYLWQSFKSWMGRECCRQLTHNLARTRKKMYPILREFSHEKNLRCWWDCTSFHLVHLGLVEPRSGGWSRMAKLRSSIMLRTQTYRSLLWSDLLIIFAENKGKKQHN